MRISRRNGGFTLIELMFVVGLIGVISAISVPLIEKTIASFRLVGTARSVTNAVAVAKIRAASTFTRVRLYVDLSTNTHHIEVLDRSVTPFHWATEGGSTFLPTGVVFGFSPVTAAPPNSQTTIAQGTPCKTDLHVDIANTGCIIFNSRGTPVDDTGASNANGVVYVTDGTAVYGISVAATGMVRLWRTFPYATPSWALQ